MKRIAAHLICFTPQVLYYTSYIELSDDYKLSGIYPLQEEIAGTVFINGAILMVPEKHHSSVSEIEEKTKQIITDREKLPLAILLDELGLSAPPVIGETYHILHLSGLNLSSSKFSANHSSSNGYIQRL